MITNFLLPGIIIGLTAGLAPGPLLALVISETLKYGRRSGIKVSLAPLFTDAPIIIVTFLIFNQLKDSNTILAFISISGGLFLIYLGYENLRACESGFLTKSSKGRSLQKAIITNALSPHPYIFWLSVGGSFIVK
ncbi:LysE family transporter, partial [candidate division WOR-3 bacterium]|nr:LysE family transporter [candidate division WOR-3 bacterium]